MRNHMMKRRLEFTMLAGIFINFLAFILPIINYTLKSDTKQYTEGYSVGSLIGILVPSALNGNKEALSDPPLMLMAFLLFGLVCWIASLFTVVLVIQSMSARKANLFRTIAVSIFELLSGLSFLLVASQMKTFSQVTLPTPEFKGHVNCNFNILGFLPAILVIILSFVNIFLLLGIVRSGEEIDEMEEEIDAPAERAPRDRARKPAPASGDYARSRQPRRPIPTDAYPPPRTPVRNNVGGEPARRPYNPDLSQTRPISATGLIDRDHLPRQSSRPDPMRQPAGRTSSATQPISRPDPMRQPAGRPAQPSNAPVHSSVSAPTNDPRTQQAATVTCTKCGAKCRRGTRFCNICGEVLSRPVSRCRSCGDTVTDKDVFCPSCGANLR